MKKNILLILAILIIITSVGCTNNNSISDTESNNNSNNSDTNSQSDNTVSINENELISFDSPNSKIYSSFKPVFRRSGDAIIADYYNDKNVLIASVYYKDNVQEYIYNDNSQIQKMTIFVFNSEREYGGFIECKYNYDENNKLLSTEQYFYSSKNIILEHTVLEYDDNGNIIKESTYNDKNELDYYNIYEYDNENNKLGSAKYDNNGKYIAGEGSLAKTE